MINSFKRKRKIEEEITSHRNRNINVFLNPNVFNPRSLLSGVVSGVLHMALDSL